MKMNDEKRFLLPKNHQKNRLESEVEKFSMRMVSIIPEKKFKLIKRFVWNEFRNKIYCWTLFLSHFKSLYCILSGVPIFSSTEFINHTHFIWTTVKQQKIHFFCWKLLQFRMYQIEMFSWHFVFFYRFDYDSCALLVSNLSCFSRDHLSSISNQMTFRSTAWYLHGFNKSFLMKFHFQAFTGYWLHNSITCNRIVAGLCKSHTKRSRCAVITITSFADVIGPRGDYISTWKSTGLGLDASLRVRL